MNIVKIGTWTKKGFPTGWIFDGKTPVCDKINPSPVTVGNVLGVPLPGESDPVMLSGIEIVEWTETRKKAMEVTE